MIGAVCAILDEETSSRAGWTLPDLAAAYLAGGARFLQVRAKRAPSGWLLETAVRIRELAGASRAIVVINDRADIARLAGAGVHVGQDDVPAGAARAIVGETAIVGLSTHTPKQLRSALTEPISYVAIGPVFETSTKVTGHEPIGTAGVTRAAATIRAARSLPLVAIGGITLESARGVIEAGADAVAVIGDLLSTRDPEARVRDFLRTLGG